MELFAESEGQSDFHVKEFKMIGFDVLWNIAFEARHQEVVRQCTAFLNQLYDKLAPTLKVTFFFMFNINFF